MKLLTIIALIYAVATAFAYQGYEGRMPDGNVHSCNTCHYSRLFLDDFRAAGEQWTAALASLDSDGVDESVTFSFRAAFNFETITVFGGYGASDGTYRGNARPKVVTSKTDKGLVKKTRIPGEEYLDPYDVGYVVVYFEERVSASEITITINEVYPGAKWPDCCISEVAIGFER